MADTDRDAYSRGEAAGKVLQRLDGHDKHFQRINGSIDKMVDGFTELTKAVTALAAELSTRDAQVKAAAEALAADAETKADAVEAIRADRADALAGNSSKWQPRAFYLSVVVALLGVAGLYLAYHH